MNKVFISILILTICSCEEWQVEKPTQNLRELIVVNSMISPQDSLLTVYVSRGEDINKVVKLDSLLIKNANVSISDGTNKEILYYNTKAKRYEAKPQKIKILEGETYFLSINYQSKTLEASCIVPKKVEGLTITGQVEKDTYFITTKWQDNDNDKNIFLLSSLIANTSRNLFSQITWDDKSLSENRIIYSRNKRELAYTGLIQNFKTNKYDKISVGVSAIDVNYEQYILKQSSISSDEGIFAGFTEIQLNFSNIKGGVGVFGAYNQSNSEIIIK